MSSRDGPVPSAASANHAASRPVAEVRCESGAPCNFDAGDRPPCTAAGPVLASEILRAPEVSRGPGEVGVVEAVGAREVVQESTRSRCAAASVIRAARSDRRGDLTISGAPATRRRRRVRQQSPVTRSSVRRIAAALSTRGSHQTGANRRRHGSAHRAEATDPLVPSGPVEINDDAHRCSRDVIRSPIASPLHDRGSCLKSRGG
jgi:hypothetical protein